MIDKCNILYNSLFSKNEFSIKPGLDSSFFYRVVFYLLIVSTVVLTISDVYVLYYGFELLNMLLHAVSLIVAVLILFVGMKKIFFFWYLVYFSYVLLVTLIYFLDVVVASLMHLSLVFLFVFALPHFNRKFSVNVDIQLFLLKVISVVTIVFIGVNVDVYMGAVFADKRLYNQVLSSVNVVGYLQYLGFSISWMLFDVTRRKIYRWFILFYFLSAMFLVPVFTVYVVVFAYIFSIFYLRRKNISKYFIICAMLLLSLYIAYTLVERFDDWKIYLSFRDLLYVNSFELIKNSFWHGYGVNNWGYIAMEMKNPHNFVLYLLLSFGFIGFFIYTIHIYFLLSNSLKNIRCFKEVKFYQHMHAQIIVHLLVMSAFVAMPGHYQDSSIFLSIYYSLLINAVMHVRDARGRCKHAV